MLVQLLQQAKSASRPKIEQGTIVIYQQLINLNDSQILF